MFNSYEDMRDGFRAMPKGKAYSMCKMLVKKRFFFRFNVALKM